LKKKVGWEFLPIAADSLIEHASLDAIKLGQVGIEDDALAADGVDDAVDGSGNGREKFGG